MTGHDVVIVGGGVIGLSVAYVLAREGVSATVIDAGPLGRAASWAGAGIIPPPSERASLNPVQALRSLGARLHAEWSDVLRSETGIDNGYRRTGGVDVAASAGEDHDLRSLAGRWRDEGIAFERLEPRDFARVEPALAANLTAAYFLPDRAQIRNPRHIRALIAACSGRGIALRPEQPVTGFEFIGNRVTAVCTADGPVACGQVLVSAGPWTAGLLEGLSVRVATPPIKGQIVLLRGNRPLLRRIVEHGKNYLVPRDDGRVLVGSTEEHAGFDTRATPEAGRELIDEAFRLCPALAETEVERAWAGLRPGSIDTRPYLGRAPEYENLFVASGHQRAGLQLAPASAVVMADLIVGRPPRIDVSPFRINREPARERELFRS